MGAPDSLWIEHFRFPRERIEYIANLLKDELSPEIGTVRAPIPLFKRVCIAIFKLATCAEYRVVGETFGVSKVSVYRCVNAFVYTMAGFKGHFITFPSSEEAAAIADRIQARHGYPQAFGAIDGSHIAINPPADGLADYLNRKMFPSLVLQGLVDDRYMFRDVSCKCPGSMHDSTVFTNSSLARTIEINMPIRNKICDGVDIPLHILGDPAYPLTKKIIKGYTGRQLGAEQESFNVYHSSARMMVENAFGRLKARWRILSKRMDCRVELSPYVIMACCCLHNLCEEMRMPVNDAVVAAIMNDPQIPQPPAQRDQRIEAGAGVVRDAIKNMLATELPLRRANHLH